MISLGFHLVVVLGLVAVGRQAAVTPEAAQPLALVFSAPNEVEQPPAAADAAAVSQADETSRADPSPVALAEPPPIDRPPPTPSASPVEAPPAAAIPEPVPETTALPPLPAIAPPPAAPPVRTVIAPVTRPRIEAKPVARPAARQAGPAPGVPIPVPVTGTVPSPPATGEINADWRGALDGWLRSHRQYPEEARRHGDEGRVVVHFTVDRQGRVSGAELVRGSGSALLDDAVLAMLSNAVVPAFPAGMEQDRVALTVQIRFTLQR